jgi:hypothetical protein
MAAPEIFISYAWRDESLKVTEALDAFFQEKGITVVRDNRDIGYKGLIKEYMQRLGRGKYVVVVLSDQYFKSKSCMFELLQLSQHEDFYDRIFPVAAEGTSIYEAEDALQYANYWDEKIEQLQAQIKNAKNIANLQGITDDLNLYVEIRQNVAKLIDFLRNINTHPLKGSNFDLLFEAIQTKMQQDRESEAQEPQHKESNPQQKQAEEKSLKQGINISIGGNATFEGMSFGDGGKVISKVEHAKNIVQADDSTVTITQAESAQQGMSVEEVLKLFEQLYEAVNEMENVPRKAKIEAKAEVEKAIAEIEEPEGEEPDKKTVAEHLKNATETLKAAGATALQAAAFGKLVAGAVTWLGANYQWLLQML